MNSWTRLWFSALQQAAEIGWYAPLVIARRLQRFADAGWPPGTADQREWVRMVSEKNAAALESATVIWSTYASAQQRAWVRALRSGVPLRTMTRDRKAAGGLVKSLRPVSRRVKANARRLTRRR